MNEKLADQLIEFAAAVNRLNIIPIICGGLGIYLRFWDKDSAFLRATNDIDIMLTAGDISEKLKRKALADVITGELEYIVSDEGRNFMFEKHGNRKLDILSQMVNIEGIKVVSERVKIVPSKLHGRLTPEADFIDEDITVINLGKIYPNSVPAKNLKIKTPSISNFLILKLFAFNDRSDSKRENSNRSQAHVWDIFTLIMLADREDYLISQSFINRHSDSEIIKTAQKIIHNKFANIDSIGWMQVLQASAFYPDLTFQQKREKLNEAKNRLLRWFNVQQEA